MMLPFVAVPTSKIPNQAGNSLAYNPSAFFDVRNEKFKNANGDMDLEDVIDEMKSLGYEIDTRPNALNVVGIRDASVAVPESYSDKIAYFWYNNDGQLEGKIAEGTTTPGIQYLNNPLSDAASKGTAILKQGQYKNSHQIGLHRSKYEALVQRGPLKVIRDNDRNSILDYFGKVYDCVGCGINIHRSTASYASQNKIGPDSAGCQVFRWIDDFNDMMTKARISKNLYGNQFTYTLIDKREQLQKQRKYGVIGLVLIGLSAYSYFLYKKGVFNK